MKKPTLFNIILLSTIVILALLIIFRKDVFPVESFDETTLREQIRVKDSTIVFWEEQSEAWHNIADTEQVRADSLQNLKPTIKYYYYEKYLFNTNATVEQLDSVIRANW